MLTVNLLESALLSATNQNRGKTEHGEGPANEYRQRKSIHLQIDTAAVLSQESDSHSNEHREATNTQRTARHLLGNNHEPGRAHGATLDSVFDRRPRRASASHACCTHARALGAGSAWALGAGRVGRWHPLHISKR